MKKIILHGELKKRFGEFFELDVQTAKEACWALGCMIPSFKAFMLGSEQKGIRYAVFLDEIKTERNISESQLDDITSAESIHIMPKMVGAGGDFMGGVLAVAGVALLGFATGGWGLLGLSAMSTATIGAGLVVGGLSSLLMPTPPKIEGADPDGNRANYGFGGAVTTIAQGNPVPVLYGERMVGGFVASAGIYTEDTQ